MVWLTVLAAASLGGWIGLLAHPARPWDLRPVGEDGPAPAPPRRPPPVCALVPARNEAALLPETLPTVLAQDYSGPFRVVVVDDRSDDGTGDVARGLGAEVVDGEALPAGWTGKVWALEQGAARAAGAEYLLLADADIRHAPGSLARLVAESERDGLALNSRMARLRAEAPAERLLIPAFAFFFACLYPMRWANDGRRPAAAGGCILLRRDALDRVGGFASIADAVIDDIALARRVGALGLQIRLAASRRDIVSLRAHDLGGVWRMVRRTAFAQLGYSRLAACGTLAGLALLFVVPPAAVAVLEPLPSALGGAAWAAMAAAYFPAARANGATPLVVTLPLAGVLYAGMTLDSAIRGPRRTGARPRPN